MQRALNMDQLCTLDKLSQIWLGGREGREKKKDKERQVSQVKEPISYKALVDTVRRGVFILNEVKTHRRYVRGHFLNGLAPIAI